MSPVGKFNISNTKKPREERKKMISILSDSEDNLNIDEGIRGDDKFKEPNDSRINTMPVSKPFCRNDYIKPKSMLMPKSNSEYINIRRRRAGFASRIDPK